MVGTSGRSRTVLSAVDAVPPTAVEPARDVAYEDLRLRELVGRGGNGIVHRVTLADETSLALKRPHIDEGRAYELFLSEAETWSHLEHPHIVRLHGWGVDPEPWMAMEFVEEGSLEERLGDLRTDEALWICIAICRALEYAHERGVMHYDLKPENVLLVDAGEPYWLTPKVTDWGLSELLLKQEGKPEGLTPTYAAPEQFARGASTDSLTDLFQLGATAYAVLTGTPPVTGHPSQIASQLEDEAWDLPTTVNPSLPPHTDRVFRTALSSSPANRFHSVREFRRALEELFLDVYDPTAVTHVGVDARRSGVVDAAGPAETPSTDWSVDLGNEPTGPPVVLDGRAFSTTTNGDVLGFELASGERTFDVSVPGRIDLGPAATDGQIHVVTDQPSLAVVDISTGEVREASLPFKPRRFVVEGRSLVFETRTGEIVSFDTDLREQWRSDLPGNPGGPIAVSRTDVLAPTYDGLCCLEAGSGTHRWTVREGEPYRGVSSLSSGSAVAAGDGTISEVTLEAGEKRWKQSVSGRVSGAAVSPTTVVAGSTDGDLLAIDRSDGDVRWATTLKGRSVGPPVLADGNVYVGCKGRGRKSLPERMEGVFAYDSTDGTRKWGYRPAGDVVGSVFPLRARGLFVTESGVLTAIE